MTPEIFLIVVAVLVALTALVFWIAMIWHCWLNAPAGRERWVWLLIIVLGKLPGAIAYYLLHERVAARYQSA